MHNNIFNYYSYTFNDSVCMPNVYTTYENLTPPRTSTTITPANNACYFWYMGMACKSSTSVQVQYEVTTLGGGFTTTDSNYYEFLMYKGELSSPLSQTSLTRLGSVSVTADVTSTGVKTKTIQLTTAIGTADEMWFAISCCTSSLPVLRSGAAASAYNVYAYTLTAMGTRLSVLGSNELSINGLISQSPWIAIKI